MTTSDNHAAWSDSDAAAAERLLSPILERLPDLPLIEPGTGRRLVCSLPDDFEALPFDRLAPAVPIERLPSLAAPVALTRRVASRLAVDLEEGELPRILGLRRSWFAAAMAACLVLGVLMAMDRPGSKAPRLVVVDVEAPPAGWMDPHLIMLETAGRVVVR